MQTEYTGRQMNISQKLRTQATLGLERIERVVGRSASAHIILTTEKHRQMAEVTVNTRKCDIVGAAESTVMEMALHEALDKAEKQALKHKEKIIGRKRNTKIEREDLYPQSIAI